MRPSVWRMWGIPTLVIVLVLVVAGLLYEHRHSGQLIVGSNTAANSSSNPVDQGEPLHGRPAPTFTLKDQFGKTITLGQFKGKVVVLAFVDSKCTTICPLTTQSMMDALQQLGPTAAKQVQLLGIDANPTAISVADVKSYSEEHQMMHSWHFLTGSLPQLKSIWKKYFIYTGIVKGQIDHTPALYIIDQKGHEQYLYLTPSEYSAISSQANVLALDIARLLPSSAHAKVAKIPYHPSTLSPKDNLTLPVITSSGMKGNVAINANSPHLLVYVASWVPQIVQDLKQLNSYAKNPSDPRLVTIDVGSTEPDQNALVPVLQKVGKISYPIVYDRSGNVADAYQVQDLAWFSLTDGHGHVIWHHDGWLPISQLRADVQKAL